MSVGLEGRSGPATPRFLEASAKAIDYPVGSVGPLVEGHPVGKASAGPPGVRDPILGISTGR